MSGILVNRVSNVFCRTDIYFLGVLFFPFRGSSHYIALS